MTVFDVVMAVRRAWVVFLVALLVAIAVAVAVYRTPGVYWTRTTVTFYPAPDGDNPLLTGTSGETAMAGVIQIDVVGHSDDRAPAGDVSIVDEGVFQGDRVRLQSRAGQWEKAYNPVLDVQVAGSDPAEVEARTHNLLQKITDALDERHRAADVLPESQMKLQIDPPNPFVQYATPRRTQATGVTLLLGFWASCVAAVTWDRRRLWGRSTPRGLVAFPSGSAR